MYFRIFLNTLYNAFQEEDNYFNFLHACILYIAFKEEDDI